MMDQVTVLIGRTFLWCLAVVAALVAGWVLAAIVRAVIW